VIVLYGLALALFALVTPPALWPGAAAFVIAWALFPRWRAHLAWAAPLFPLYLLYGVNLQDAAAMKQLAWLAIRLTSGLLAFAYSAALAEGSARAAPLPFLLWALLSRPTGGVLALGLLAWAGWVYLLNRRESRRLGTPFFPQRRALALAAAGLLLAAAGLATLGGFAPRFSHTPAHTLEAPALPANTPVTPVGGDGSRQAPPAGRPVALPAWQQQAFRALWLLTSLALPVLLALLIALWWRMLKTPAEKRPADRRSLELVLLSLLSVLAGGFWLALFAYTKGGAAGAAAGAAPAAAGGAPGGPAAPAAGHTPGNGPGLVLILGMLGVLLLTLFFAYLAYRLLRTEPLAAAEAAEAGAKGGRRPVFAGRVRAAYREFLRLMRGRVPISRSETPREYAARLARLRPRLSAAVRELTGLYEPVRYGGLADQTEAERAEALVRRIARELENEEEAT